MPPLAQLLLQVDRSSTVHLRPAPLLTGQDPGTTARSERTKAALSLWVRQATQSAPRPKQTCSRAEMICVSMQLPLTDNQELQDVQENEQAFPLDRCQSQDCLSITAVPGSNQISYLKPTLRHGFGVHIE